MNYNLTWYGIDWELVYSDINYHEYLPEFKYYIENILFYKFHYTDSVFIKETVCQMNKWHTPA